MSYLSPRLISITAYDSIVVMIVAAMVVIHYVASIPTIRPAVS